MRVSIFGVLALILSIPFVCLASNRFDKKNTYAVIVGVLHWKDPNIGTFPLEGRQDRVLKETLIRRGVPEKNILYLEDQQATKERVLDGLTSLAKLAGPKSTFVFYYAGHGALVDGSHFFYNYDINHHNLNKTGLSVATLKRILIQHFRGERLLLFADCCFSGILGQVAEEVSRTLGIYANALTSADDSTVSTDKWTYTEALISILSGSSLADEDQDGVITQDEASRFIADEMNFKEFQLAKSFVMEPTFIFFISEAAVAQMFVGSFLRGQYVEVKSDDGLRFGRVLDWNGLRYLVKLVQSEEPIWLDSSLVKKPPTFKFPVGFDVIAHSHGKTYAGKVMRAKKNGFHLVAIAYEGVSAGVSYWFPVENVKASAQD